MALWASIQFRCTMIDSLQMQCSVALCLSCSGCCSSLLLLKGCGITSIWRFPHCLFESRDLLSFFREVHNNMVEIEMSSLFLQDPSTQQAQFFAVSGCPLAEKPRQGPRRLAKFGSLLACLEAPVLECPHQLSLVSNMVSKSLGPTTRVR